MDWQRNNSTVFPLDVHEPAEKILQIYMESLQNPENLDSIISDNCILDYFGKYYHGKEAVSSQIIKYLHGSNYEISNYKLNDHPSKEWELASHESESDQDLGVSFLSPPTKVIFPSLMITPNRLDTQKRRQSVKRKANDACLDGITRNMKMCKVNGDEFSKESISDSKDMEITSPTIRKIIPDNLKYILAQGTIRYPKKLFSSNDPKRLKHHSVISPRDRFCQLDLGFELDPDENDFKIWRIRYCISSRVTPKNLLKLFNEVEPD